MTLVCPCDCGVGESPRKGMSMLRLQDMKTYAASLLLPISVLQLLSGTI